MIRTIPVAPELLGLVAAGQPDPIMVWDEDNGRRVQTDRPETDDDGTPLWTCYLMPTTAERPEIIQVRVAARQQPVLTLFAPVAVDNLTVNVRVGRDGKVAQYWSAADVRDGGQQHRRNGQAEHKPAESAA